MTPPAPWVLYLGRLGYGLANAAVRPKLFGGARLVINLEPAFIIVGRVQNEQG